MTKFPRLLTVFAVAMFGTMILFWYGQTYWGWPK